MPADNKRKIGNLISGKNKSIKSIYVTEVYHTSEKEPNDLINIPIEQKTVLSLQLENEFVKYALAMDERYLVKHDYS